MVCAGTVYGMCMVMCIIYEMCVSVLCMVMCKPFMVSDSYPAFFLLIATTSNKKILKVQKL
jgi:hypothetical protein